MLFLPFGSEIQENKWLQNQGHLHFNCWTFAPVSELTKRGPWTYWPFLLLVNSLQREAYSSSSFPNSLWGTRSEMGSFDPRSFLSFFYQKNHSNSWSYFPLKVSDMMGNMFMCRMHVGPVVYLLIWWKSNMLLPQNVTMSQRAEQTFKCSCLETGPLSVLLQCGLITTRWRQRSPFLWSASSTRGDGGSF